jgi:flagellin
MEQAMERLSSGKRINSAMDDAAGLTIAHSLDGKIASLNQAVRNANDGVALVNLAEGALEEVSTMLVRMKELATQSLNSTYSTNDRANLDKEYQALVEEIDHIAKNTKFNGSAVLYPTDSDTAASLSFQVGDGSSDSISLALANMDKTTLDLYNDSSGSNSQGISSTTLATSALTDIDAAISTVDGYRATLGATANRLDHAATNLMSRVEHHSAALSRIEDADYAVESANLAKAQVLQQAGTAMLAQANASTSNVVSLLR